MPPRRDFTPEELLVRLDEQREQGRLRAARWRARHRVTVINEGNANGVTRTPPSPPAPPAPSKSRSSYGTPPRGHPKVQAVIDGLRAAGLAAHLSKRDCASLKATTLDAAEVVEAYRAVFRGEWDNAWLKKNLSVERVVDAYAGYLASRRPTRPATNGVHHDPMPGVVLEADLERIAPAAMQRELAERATVPLEVKLARIREGAKR